MKKTNQPSEDDMRSEYDFASMRGGIQGKYADLLRNESNIVLLDPEVADAFPTEKAVNAALRGVLQTTKTVPEMGGLPNKSLPPATRKTRRG